MKFLKRILLIPKLTQASYFYMRGLSFLIDKKHEKAINEFSKIISLTIDYVFINYVANKYTGICYFYLNDVSNAKKVVFKACELKNPNENDSEFYWGLGWVYDWEKRLPEARKYYELALKYFKKNDLTDVSYIKHRLNKINEYIVKK